MKKLYDTITSENLKTLPNVASKAYHKISVPEFTMLGAGNQPDFGVLTVEYNDCSRTLELKSFKEYLYQYRDTILSYERAIEVLFNHLETALDTPSSLEVKIEFRPRGGISSTLTRYTDYS